ncbi:MAG TPA: FAD/NAD(P)-binding protein [Desulfobacterales bacterium]
MLQWLIIGGGIHGSYMANWLINQAGVAPDDLRVLDPHDRLLAVWRRNTANCGMRYLRSPGTHHIDLPILSLYRFAKTCPDRSGKNFIPPYNRPSLALFERHSRHVIAKHRLDELHVRGRALSLEKGPGGMVVETGSGRISARNLLLAIGMGEQLCRPGWVEGLQREGADVSHVFEPDFRRRRTPPADRTAIVGGGITAVQTALRLTEETRGEIQVISSHGLKERFYDFDPCWIGPKCLRDYYRLGYRQRRRVIDEARFPGTLPAEVMSAFQTVVGQERLRFLRGEIKRATVAGGRIRLEMDNGSQAFDRVILATGFLPRRPGGALIDAAVKTLNLRCNPCGYPIVGDDLRWDEHLYVTGPLAELQIGPCARNIIGARNAGRHLLRAVASPAAPERGNARRPASETGF